jgi:hypothetical protein
MGGFQATYIVGDYQYSPLAIEHSILRANSYRPSLVLTAAPLSCLLSWFVLSHC